MDMSLPGSGNARPVVSIHRKPGRRGGLVIAVECPGARALRDIHLRTLEGSAGGCTIRERVEEARNRQPFLSPAALGFLDRNRYGRWTAVAVSALGAGGMGARPGRGLSRGPAHGRGARLPLSSPRRAYLMPSPRVGFVQRLERLDRRMLVSSC